MDFELGPECERLAEEARSLGMAATRHRACREHSWVSEFDRQFSEELGRRGWLGMTWPVELGGGGRTPLEHFVVTEALVSTGAPIAATWIADRQIGPALIAHGTDAQRRRYLPGMIKGTVTWCIGMSEANSGSDLASLRTRALPVSDGFVINGSKVWTSLAAVADFCYLIARTGSESGRAGLSEFIVEMTSPGIHVRRIRDAAGRSDFCELEFSDVYVPTSNLVGVLGGGWTQLMSQLEHERGGVDRLMSNRALFEAARDCADTSRPQIRDELTRLECAYHVGRLLVLREVLGQAPPSFSAATKAFCTEHEQKVAQFIARVSGPRAMLESRVSKALVYSPAYTIQGGTSEILRNIIAERVLGLPSD